MADGSEQVIQASAGSTVADVLAQAGVQLSALDRTEPALTTILQENTAISIIRVKESFEVVERELPFEQITVRNETLTAGQQLLVQAGSNGLEEITYRVLTENGKETSRMVAASRVLQEPKPEIIMVGVHSLAQSTDLPGRLAFLAGGSAWMLEGPTGNRQPLILTGDLDGRVFELSEDGSWLLYTRAGSTPDTINTLWAAEITATGVEEHDLGVENIIHFASWVPGEDLEITCSTVEPRDTAPGWQANNDLIWLELAPSGRVISRETVIEPHSGGLYGWWGTSYLWSPDGSRLAFARPDAIGLINLKNGRSEVLAELLPAQTDGEWAWVPGLTWGKDSRSLLWVQHETAPGYFPREKSPRYSVAEIDISTGTMLTRVSDAGMFAAPVPSPDRTRLAYLQAIFPAQSDTSRYRLVVSSMNGTRAQLLFPGEGSAGLTPQVVAWSPESKSPAAVDRIALIYQGNLWLVDAQTGYGQQVTADGTITGIDWK